MGGDVQIQMFHTNRGKDVYFVWHRVFIRQRSGVALGANDLHSNKSKLQNIQQRTCRQPSLLECVYRSCETACNLVFSRSASTAEVVCSCPRGATAVEKGMHLTAYVIGETRCYLALSYLAVASVHVMPSGVFCGRLPLTCHSTKYAQSHCTVCRPAKGCPN